MSAHKDRLIQAAELLGMAPDDLFDRLSGGWQGAPDTFRGGDGHPHADTPGAPDGFAVVAHWSAAHDGINVEVDAPEGLPLTIHVNDWRMLNVVVGTDEQADTDDEPFPQYGPATLTTEAEATR